MNKRLLGIAIVVLLSAILASALLPAMAAPTKKSAVTFTRTGSFVTTGDHWYSEEGDYHLRATTVGFKIFAIAGQDIAYSGSSVGTMRGNLHDIHIVGSAIIGEGGSVTDSKIILADGTFEGIIQMKGSFAIFPETAAANLRGYMNLVNGEFRAIWHGTGIYIGQSLKLEYSVTNGVISTPLTGTLLIP